MESWERDLADYESGIASWEQKEDKYTPHCEFCHRQITGQNDIYAYDDDCDMCVCDDCLNELAENSSETKGGLTCDVCGQHVAEEYDCKFYDPFNNLELTCEDCILKKRIDVKEIITKRAERG